MDDQLKQDVIYQLGKIASLVESTNTKLDMYISDNKKQNQDLDQRVTVLETKETARGARISMLAGTGGLASGILGTLIMRMLGHNG